MIDIRQALTDPNLFGEQFGGESFAAWRALLAAFYGLELTEEELETLKALTDLENVPRGAFDELWLAIGRRGGKSQIAALIAVYEALFIDHREKLSAGEVATVMCIAADRKQARSVMRYVIGLVTGNAMLKRSITREQADIIEFDNRAVIEVHTASFRSTRGYTLACAILDEVAFWFAEGANPDREVVAGLRPGLATLGGKLVGLSSPYAKRGILWDIHKRHYGGGSERVLVAQAPTHTMNPTLPPHIVDDAIAEDPERARAEYLAEFRGDISTFLDADVIERATRFKPETLPYVSGDHYFGFVDPNGGGADEFSLAIGHCEGAVAVVDMVLGRHGSPASIVEEFAAVLRQYRISTVSGDRYAGRWPRDEFTKHGITYETSRLDRSALYLEFMARLNSGGVFLPPDKVMQRQMVALERRTHRSGRDTIDHPPGSHNDRANAVAGVVAHATQRKPQTTSSAVGGLI